MASKIDFSSLTLNEEEARNSSEAVFEILYSRPEIAAVHGIQTGIDMDRRIPIMGQFDLVGQTDPGSCGVNTNASQIPVSEKTWTPALISDRMVHCQDDVPDLLKFWKKSMIAANNWEEVDNEMIAFIEDRITDAAVNSVLRLSSFGDTAADTVANGGTLTNGTTKGYFTSINGIWKQVFTDRASGTPKTTYYEISENTEATKVGQLALSADRAYLAMQNLKNNIDPRAFDGGNLVFQVTRSLANNYADYMRKNSLGFTLEVATNGITNMSFDGIPIIVRNDWDRVIKTYFDNGTTYYLPHRILLADINNIPIGTSDEGSITELQSHYDRTDKKHYLDIAFKLDVKILQEELVGVAY